MSTTISVHRGCAGGYVGAGHVHPALLDAVREALAARKDAGEVLDGYVTRCGDDIGLVLLHRRTLDAATLAAEVLSSAGVAARRLAQHGLNGDGVGHEGASMTFEARASEPVLCFFADKAGAGAWNMHLYRAFADPFNSTTLVSDDEAMAGFTYSASGSCFDLPDQTYELIRAVREDGAVIDRVWSRSGGEVVAAATSGSDPVLIVRCEAPFPAVGEVLEAFAFPYAVGRTPGQAGPLMPVSTHHDASTRSSGSARVIGLGFQVAADRLVGPRDLLGDAAFEDVRHQALAAAEYLRRHGPLWPNGGPGG